MLGAGRGYGVEGRAGDSVRVWKTIRRKDLLGLVIGLEGESCCVCCGAEWKDGIYFRKRVVACKLGVSARYTIECSTTVVIDVGDA